MNMETEPHMIDALEFFLRWAVVPLGGLLWWVMMQLANLDRQVIKLVTLFDARVSQRDEDRAAQQRINSDLLHAIERLDARFAKFTETMSNAANNK